MGLVVGVIFKTVFDLRCIMGFVRNVKYFCGERYFETDLFEVSDVRERGKKMREKKVNLSSADQVRRNKKQALRTFRQKVKTNFTGNDVYLTLTYDTLHRPDSTGAAKKDFHNYVRRVNRRRKKEGLPPAKYMGTIERKGMNIHFHMIISGGLDRNELEDIWGKGLSNASRLRIDDEELMQRLCQYILKEARDKEKFENTYICSRNLAKPKVTKTDWAFTHRKLEELAGMTDCREVWERLYPGYEYIEAASTFSELTGWHITVKMTRRDKDVHPKEQAYPVNRGKAKSIKRSHTSSRR